MAALPSSKAGADKADVNTDDGSAIAHHGELPAAQQAEHPVDADSHRYIGQTFGSIDSPSDLAYLQDKHT